MALNIKDATTHRLARELAERRGTTMTQAVADALAEALARTSTPPASPKLSRLEADLARLAYAKYGRGAHRAALNFGDCFAYALATRLGAPLLYQGTGFSLTDVTGA